MSPRTLQIAAGAGVLVLVGAFFFFLNVADTADPPAEPVRIDVTDALNAPAQP